MKRMGLLILFLCCLIMAIGGTNAFAIPTTGSIPEPATMLLVGAGLIGLAGLGRKKFLKK